MVCKIFDFSQLDFIMKVASFLSFLVVSLELVGAANNGEKYS
jgi:hypothetical protein